jgi:hypothetical protein
MMKNFQIYLKKAQPYLLATVFFVVFSFAYFSPLLNNKDLPQMDQTHVIGMSKEVVDFKAKTGEDSHWTNSMFGGMPTYQIAMGTSYNIYIYIQRFLRLGLPYTTVSILFIYMFGFYLLLLSLKFNNLQSVLGGIGFGLASYNIIIIAVGHITKTYAIAYMAPVIAGVIMTYNGKYLWGGILSTFAIGVEISTNHIQVIYYLILMVFLLVLVMFIYAIIEKQLKKFLIASFILLGSAIMGFIPNITNLATTYEYGKESIRGKSELTDNVANKTSGLDKDYAYAWSYGVDETFTLLIPNVKGGASVPLGLMGEDAFKDINPKFIQAVAEQDQYFGTQSFTAGPVYFGAIMMFLFILGILIVRGKLKWWLIGTFILGVILSWGGNVRGFTDLLFDYLPFYNKFRTLSMSLVISGFAVVLLAMFAIKELIDNKQDGNKKFDKTSLFLPHKMAILISAGITGLLTLIIFFVPDILGGFLSGREINFLNSLKDQDPALLQQYNILFDGVKELRMDLVQADAIRSFAFILLASALIYLYSATNILKNQYFIIGLTLLVVVDLWTIDKRYLKEDNFKPKREVKNPIPMTEADRSILKDLDPNYRVLNISKTASGQRINPFTDALTPYYHKSIGGYHGAKLRRYQDVIERYLGYEVQVVGQALDNDTIGSINDVLRQTSIINMLNTKYLICDANSIEINWNALGHAWFVDDYAYVKNADEEIKMLGKFNPSKTAIIDEKFKSKLTKLADPEFFSLDTGYIKLESYKPNHLVYKSASRKDRLAVFSEIYYDKGWNAYIDGFKTDHIRVNYILRAIVAPAGIHTIEFKFEPKTHSISMTIALISSTLLVLALLSILYIQYKRKLRQTKPIE